MGQGVPKEKANDRHHGLEHSENQGDLKSQFPIDTRDADRGRSTEVVQTHRHRNQEQREHLSKRNRALPSLAGAQGVLIKSRTDEQATPERFALGGGLRRCPGDSRPGVG